MKATVSGATLLRTGQNSMSSDPAIRSAFFEAELQPLYTLKGTVARRSVKVSYELGQVTLPMENL